MEDFTDPLILQSLEGAEAARLLTIATFALLVYEWFITLDSEASRTWSYVIPLPRIDPPFSDSVFLERKLVKVADALFGSEHSYIISQRTTLLNLIAL